MRAAIDEFFDDYLDKIAVSGLGSGTLVWITENYPCLGMTRI